MSGERLLLGILILTVGLSIAVIVQVPIAMSMREANDWECLSLGYRPGTVTWMGWGPSYCGTADGGGVRIEDARKAKKKE